MKKFNGQRAGITCAEVNRRDMVDFLATLGHQPTRVSPPSYWYLSPLRGEKSASFKVNRKLNKWYDFGIQEGGSLVDFCTRLYNCSIADVLQKFADPVSNLTNVPPIQPDEAVSQPSEITDLSVHYLRSEPLLRYLTDRHINISVALKYCKEADYTVGEKNYYAIAFLNHSGGYELRNRYFKGSSSPKDYTLIDHGKSDLYVFEGFFDFLTYLTLVPQLDPTEVNYLILNSVGMIDRAEAVILAHKKVYLFLDNDAAGDKATDRIINGFPDHKIQDSRTLYKSHKDLNDWACQVGQPKGSTQKKKPK